MTKTSGHNAEAVYSSPSVTLEGIGAGIKAGAVKLFVQLKVFLWVWDKRTIEAGDPEGIEINYSKSKNTINNNGEKTADGEVKPNYKGYVKAREGERPQNFSPEGAGREGAFKEAKRVSGIPGCQGDGVVDNNKRTR